MNKEETRKNNINFILDRFQDLYDDKEERAKKIMNYFSINKFYLIAINFYVEAGMRKRLVETIRDSERC
ncbi:MAG: hypothetical protein GQ540_03385 [Lutibacter sp.]|uniref:hypothetical protein n=1 Tax=Lutibacter sp. TaxID=1925666 RepID=UPI001A0D15F9|nr:hypothetical protein [Lutibacter sp.]NOR27555.1 hypothetical protein [Lutibacter sp.]